MSGPEHYREAERLLGIVDGVDVDEDNALIRMAQVHATLALAAATAVPSEDRRSSEVAAWSAVTS